MSRLFDRRLFAEARSQRLPLILAILAGLVAGVLIVFQARTLSAVVDGAFLGGQGWPEIRAVLLILIAVTLLRAGANFLGEVAAARAARRIKDVLRARLAAHILALGPAFTHDERTGELAAAAIDGVEALDAFFREYLPQVALAGIAPLTLLLFVFPLDPLTGLVLLFTAPLIPVFMLLIGNLADALTRRQWAALSRMSAHFLDMLQGLPTLKLFNASRAQIATIQAISDAHRDATLRVLRVAFLSALVLEMVGTLSTAIVAVEIGLRLLAGRLEFGQALFVLVLAPEFYLPLRLLGARFHAGVAGVTAAARIYEVLDIPTERAPFGPATPDDVVRGAPPAIALRNVSFAHSGRAAVLRDFNLEIAAGEKVALVGASGAGKSSVAALLLRFYAPDSGEILVDGRSLHEIPRETWRRQVAWTPQAAYLFNTTVRENISLARPAASEAEIAAAAKAAGAAGFIAALPQGYDTVIGERGARLSGGQAQRIALARAFLADAPFVILDEATASLDPVTEAEVQASIDRLLAGRSALIIAHRGTSLAAADRVVRLVDGRAVAEPTAPVRPCADPQPATASPAATSVSSKGATHPAGGRPAGRPLPHLLSFLAPHWRWIALSVLFGFLTVGSSVGLLAASAWLISMAALQPSIAVLQVAIVGVRFFGISRGVARYCERLVSHQVTFRVLARLRVWFYSAIEPLAPAQLVGRRSGDLLSRIVADIGALENFYIRAFAPPLVALLVGGLVMALLGAYHPRLVLPFLALYLLAGVGLPLLTWRLGRGPGRILGAVRAALNATLVDGVQGAADLAAFGAERRYLQRLAEQGERLGRLNERMAVIAAAGSAGGNALAWLAAAAVLAVAVTLAAAGSLPGVALAVVALATMAGFEAALPLPVAAQYVEASMAADRRLLELTSAAQPAALTHSAGEIPPSSEGVCFSHVTLRYAPAEAPALQDVSLTVPRGRLVTVVGASGAGKSSLMNVLLRFWEIEAGSIFLDGRAVHEMTPEEVRAQVGVVAQHTHLFNATVRANLLLARPDATQAQIVAAACAAQIHDFISGLPAGYDTWIGENGHQLSGGERQRLAIARALLKDAPVLLLDEPATNLDTATEAALWQALAPLMEGRTTLLITHRLGGRAARGPIVVLDAGRVVETGAHDELLARGGVYARLWAAGAEA